MTATAQVFLQTTDMPLMDTVEGWVEGHGLYVHKFSLQQHRRRESDERRIRCPPQWLCRCHSNISCLYHTSSIAKPAFTHTNLPIYQASNAIFSIHWQPAAELLMTEPNMPHINSVVFLLQHIYETPPSCHSLLCWQVKLATNVV